MLLNEIFSETSKNIVEGGNVFAGKTTGIKREHIPKEKCVGEDNSVTRKYIRNWITGS